MTRPTCGMPKCVRRGEIAGGTVRMRFTEPRVGTLCSVQVLIRVGFGAAAARRDPRRLYVMSTHMRDKLVIAHYPIIVAGLT